jgi:hypothetical protein
MTDDALFDDWVTWIEKVRADLTSLAANRRNFRDVTKVFRHNQHLQEVAGYLYEWIRANYAASAAMSFRREVDWANHYGFVYLLEEIAAKPHVLSRRRHHQLWGPEPGPLGDQIVDQDFELMPFVRSAADRMDDHIDPDAVRAHIAELREQTKVAHRYVEQNIAHRTHHAGGTLTFAEFHKAITALMRTFKRYYARLTLSSLVQLEPVAQFNTHEPFTFPWCVVLDRAWRDARVPINWEAIHNEYANDEDARRRTEEDGD